jgi:hypothetical protein
VFPAIDSPNNDRTCWSRFASTRCCTTGASHVLNRPRLSHTLLNYFPFDPLGAGRLG